MALTHDDVQRLLQLLDASHFDELHLEADGLKLSLRRNGAGAGAVSGPVAGAGAVQPAPPSVTAAAAPPAPPPPAPTAGQLDIRAPMLGTFYSAPKPGAAAFVQAGSRVAADTVVAVIEVMKLMNSIAAGVEGEVADVLVRDGELVEFDQVLMRVRPS